MSVSTTVEMLETRVCIKGDGTSASISFFAVETTPATQRLNSLHGVRVARPRKKAHLVTVEVGWETPCNMHGMLIFDLEREFQGRDIPTYLPNEVRLHVLLTSEAVFSYLEDMLS